jgi:hypothetical protein
MPDLQRADKSGSTTRGGKASSAKTSSTKTTSSARASSSAKSAEPPLAPALPVPSAPPAAKTATRRRRGSAVPTGIAPSEPERDILDQYLYEVSTYPLLLCTNVLYMCL